MEMMRERTKAEVEMTLASDALGSPDIAPFSQLKRAGCFRTVGDKAVPGSRRESSRALQS